MVPFLNRKNCCACSIFFILPLLAVAQQQQYYLSELVAAAQHHLPVIQQGAALINSARATELEIRHSLLPQVKLSDQVNIGTDNSLAGSYLPIGITPSSSAGVRADNVLQPATGNIGALYGEYQFFNFGLNKARLASAATYTALQQSELAQQVYFIEVQVAKTYFNLLKAQYRFNADKQNVNRYDSIFTVISALTSSGIKPGADSAQAKAELSKARSTFNQTKGVIQQLKQELFYFTGIAPAAIKIDSLPDNFLNNQRRTFNFEMDTLRHPLIDVYEKRERIFMANENVIRKTYMPRFSVAAATWLRGSAIQYNDEYKSLATGLGYQRYNYMAGISVSYNLFNSLFKRDKLAINRFNRQASTLELDQQKQALLLAEMKADNALATTEENLLELPVQLQSAKDTYGQKLAQYKAGIITLIDLTNASFVLYRSQTDYIETIGDWYLAQLDKATATGNLLTFIQLIK